MPLCCGPLSRGPHLIAGVGVVRDVHEVCDRWGDDLLHLPGKRKAGRAVGWLIRKTGVSLGRRKGGCEGEGGKRRMLEHVSLEVEVKVEALYLIRIFYSRLGLLSILTFSPLERPCGGRGRGGRFLPPPLRKYPFQDM